MAEYSDQATLQAAFDAALAELKGKERKLVVEYLRDLHQRNAAIRAGYSAHTADVQASQILRKLKVRQAVNAGLALYAMPADEVLARLSQQARGSMSDCLRMDDEEITLTWSLLSVPETKDGEADIAGAVMQLAAMENVKPTDRVLHTATIKRPIARLDLLEAGRRGLLGLVKKYGLDDKGKVTIELYDAQAAQQLLGKAHQLFVEKTEHSGAVTIKVEYGADRST